MTENASNIALEWIRGLQARGVTLAIRNGRLWLRPASAYRELTDEELIVLRHHRQAIKDAVAFGVPPVVPQPTPEPAQTDAQAEHTTPMREVPEHIRRVIDWNTPAETERRRREATAVMFRTVGKKSPYL